MPKSFFSYAMMYSSVQCPSGPMKVKPEGKLANKMAVLLSLVRFLPGFLFSTC